MSVCYENWLCLQTCCLNNAALALFVSDGVGKGLDADFTITNFSIEQPLEEAITVSVTAEPTNIGGTSGRAPTWNNSGPTASAGSSGT